jgi:hypothetical protein
LPGDPRSERRDQVGFGHDERCDQELRQAQHYAAGQPERDELTVHKPCAIPLSRYQEMGRRRKPLDVGIFCKGWMPRTRDACEAFPKQRACHDACRSVDWNANCEACLATVEEVDDFVLAENAADPHPETRRLNC